MAYGRQITVFAAACTMVLVGLAGCGSSDQQTIVAVGTQTISKDALAHWIPVETLIDRGKLPQAPVPDGEVPDPPRYAACVRLLAQRARTSSGQTPAPTPHVLKARCRARYQAVREHILRILITYAWLKLEADQQGISVSQQEARSEFERYRREQFKTNAAFRRYLKYTGETMADELLVSRMDLLSTALQKKIIADRGLAGARRYFTAFPKRWASKTDCRPRFVVPNCKQYRGSVAPEAVV